MREMKDSGVAWIGEIPKTWELIRYKDKYKNSKEIAGDKSNSYERLALTLNGVIKRPKDDSDGLQPKEFDTYQVLHENDFVFKMIDLQNVSTSRVGLSPYTGLVSPAYIRFRPKSKKQYPRFIYYFLMSMYYNCVFNNLGGDGVRSALNASDMGMLLMPYPIESEQHRIADRLDVACSKVDALIANQQAQIEKLKAYKQSLITEVVTRGLNPDAPMKDSGVEWIGMIPEGWKYLKSFYIYDNIGDVDHYMPNSVAEGVPYVMTGDLMDVVSKIDFEKCKKISQLDYEKLSKKITPNRGDIIFARYATIGTVCYVDVDKEFIVSYSCVTIKPNRKKVDGKYLWFYYQSAAFLEEVKKLINSNTQANVGMESLYRANIIVPPLNEQKEIIDYLDNKCAKIDALIAIKQQKIEKLGQYKKSLIYEYVTGKKEA